MQTCLRPWTLRRPQDVEQIVCARSADEAYALIAPLREELIGLVADRDEPRPTGRLAPLIDRAAQQVARSQPNAVLASLRHIETTVRTGVYVLIVNGELRIWMPVAIPPGQFINRFDLQRMRPRLLSRTPLTLPDARTWWCNSGGVVCNQGYTGGAAWTMSLLPVYRERLAGACAGVRWAEFILNPRDHPCVRRDGFAFPYLCGPYPTAEEAVRRREGLLPFLSPYINYEHFDDIGLPLPGKLHRPTGVPTIHKAVFRGSTTGFGVGWCNRRQQFVAVAQACPSIDAAITSWSRRERTDPITGQLEFPEAHPPAGLPVGQQHFLTAEQQSAYAASIYICGHSAADRLAQLLLQPGPMLWLDDPRLPFAREMWFTPLLQPGVHYLPLPFTVDAQEMEHNVRQILDADNADVVRQAHDFVEQVVDRADDYLNLILRAICTHQLPSLTGTLPPLGRHGARLVEFYARG